MKNIFKQDTYLPPASPWFCAVLVLLLILVAFTITLLASVPPISRDALTHHLYVPLLYLQHGGIYELPNIAFSYYPMNLDLLYTVALYFGNDIVPKYVHFFFALLTSLLIFQFLRNRVSIIYALIGSIFFLSIPIIVKLSITVYVDLGLMFFTTASLMLLISWVKSGYRIYYLIFAGICCGLAAGVKYNGLISFFLLPLFVPFLYIRSQPGSTAMSGRGIGYSLVFTGMALLIFSPWLIRNYIWTGNPIYPLHDTFIQEVLTSENSKTDKEFVDQDKSIETLKNETGNASSFFANRKILYGEKWWQALLLPIRFFFEGQDDNPRYFDGKLTPFLLILPFFAFLKTDNHQKFNLEKYTLLAFSVLFFFFAFFLGALRIRYIVPIVGPLTILSVFGLSNIVNVVSKISLLRMRKHATEIVFITTLGSMLMYNANYIFMQFKIVQPLSLIRGDVTRDQYITRFRPEYPTIQYANSFMVKDSIVLCLFLGNRGYYMNFTPIFENPFQKGFVKEILTQNADVENLASELLNKNIEYILLRNDLTQKWHQNLAMKQQAAVTSFFQNSTNKLFENGGYSLHKINKKS